MSYADHHPGYRVQTEEEAQAWVLELVSSAEEARRACDVQLTKQKAQKAYATWLMRHGSALGALLALHRVGRLGDVAYNELRARVMATLTPTVLVGG